MFVFIYNISIFEMGEMRDAALFKKKLKKRDFD